MIPPTNYVLATVEGLHLTCDFTVHSAALFGCPPDYVPTPAGLHDEYREPYEVYGFIPFGQYDRMALGAAAVDQPTLEVVSTLDKHSKLKNYTCIAFEIETCGSEYFRPADSDPNPVYLKYLLEHGERILDVLRLFLFKPGGNKSIGRVGAIGNGVCGVWLGDAERSTFIARKLFNHQLAQEPFVVTLNDVREIHENPVFHELRSAGCSDPKDDDDLLKRVFQSLRALRESREIADFQARFLRLASIAEHLAKRERDERLKGSILRDRIARIAEKGWIVKPNILGTVSDLWDNARNPLTHSVETFSNLGRNPEDDIKNMELIVLRMIQAVVLAWRNTQFDLEPYKYLLDEP